MKELTEAARCAKLIREELKTVFPKIKFRVNSKNFSMGDDVTIRWDNGPTTEQVDAIVDKYQDGDFDGMQDLYEYRKHNDNIPRTKYVMTQRELTTEFVTYIANKIAEKAGHTIVELGERTPFLERYDNWHQTVWRFVSGKDLTDFKELTLDEIVLVNNGEQLWRVVWETPEQGVSQLTVPEIQLEEALKLGARK
jgi:hypothetical protein